MKQVIITILTLIFLSCQTTVLENGNIELKKFNEFLGQDKAVALNQAVTSLDNFLIINFTNPKTQKEKIKAFLRYLSTYLAPDSNWTFDTQTINFNSGGFNHCSIKKVYFILRNSTKRNHLQKKQDMEDF